MTRKYIAITRRLATYAFPAFIILVVFFFSVTYVHSTLKKEAENYSQDAVYFLSNFLDQQLLSAESAAGVYLGNRTVVRLSNTGEKNASLPSVSEAAYSLSADIISFCNRNKMAEDLLIYFPKLNRVVGKNGYLTPYQYYKSIYQSHADEGTGYHAWAKTVLDCTGIQILTYTDPATGMTSTYHFQGMPANTPAKDCNRIMILLVNKQAVGKAVTSISEVMNIESIKMITETGTQYYDWVSNQAIADSHPIFAEVKSNTWDMNIQIHQSFSAAYSPIVKLQKTLSVCILIAVILASLVIGYFFINSSNSIRRLQTLLPAHKENLAWYNTDFDWIAEKVNELYQENCHHIEQINLQAEILSSAFFKDLINRDIRQTRQLTQLCNIYDVPLEHPYIKILLIRPEVNYESFQHIMHTLLVQWESDSFWFCWTSINKNSVILCNWSKSFVLIDSFSREISKLLAVKIDESEIFTSIEEIAERYSNLCNKNHCRAPVTKTNCDSIAELFLDALDDGNYKKCTRLLPGLSKWAIKATDSKYELCRRYAFLAQLYEVSISQLSKDEFDQLFFDRTGELWESILYGCLIRLAKQKEKMSIPLMAYKIIEQEYADTQLGVASIADRLCVSQSYLSRVFKEQYEDGISITLNRKRIEIAKELMLSGTQSIKEIALQVGFNSDMNFIRVFKKFESMTPGIFRKEYAEAE